MYVNIPYMKLPYGYTNIHRPQGDSRWHCPPFEGSIFFARFCHWEVFVGPFQEGSSFVKLSNLHYTLLMGQGYTVIHPSSGDASLFQHADAMEVCKFIDTVLVDSNWRIYSKYSLIRSKSKIDVLFSFVSACNLYMLVPHKDVCHNSGWHIAIWWNMCWHIGCYVCNSKQPIQQEMTYEYG